MAGILTGPSKKIIGIVVAFAVMGILAGLSFFNAGQQKSLNNDIGILLILLPIVLIIWLMSMVAGGARRRRGGYIVMVSASVLFVPGVGIVAVALAYVLYLVTPKVEVRVHAFVRRVRWMAPLVN